MVCFTKNKTGKSTLWFLRVTRFLPSPHHSDLIVFYLSLLLLLYHLFCMESPCPNVTVSFVWIFSPSSFLRVNSFTSKTWSNVSWYILPWQRYWILLFLQPHHSSTLANGFWLSFPCHALSCLEYLSSFSILYSLIFITIVYWLFDFFHSWFVSSIRVYLFIYFVTDTSQEPRTVCGIQ